MSKEERIKHEIEEIWYTLLHAKTSFYYADYLFNPPTRQEQDYMSHGEDMLFFRDVLWRSAVIGLANFFAKDQKRSVVKLLNKLDGGGEFCKVVPRSVIEIWRSKLTEHDGVIEKIKTLRNKMYAHSEIAYRDSLQFNAFDKDVEILIILVQDFISTIFTCFNAQVIHGDKLPRNFNTLKILADYEEKRRDDIVNEYKNFTKQQNQ